MSDETPDADATSSAREQPAGPWIRHGLVATLLAALSGTLYFLGFAGFEIWPLSLVSLVPLLLALRGRAGFRAFALGWLMGFVTNAGGFYWIVSMLKTFSGFRTILCILFSSLLWAGQGLQFGFFAWFVARADQWKARRLLSVPAALGAHELAFPLLFPSYTSNSLHNVPLLVQTADLGGPILISMAMAAGCAAIEDVIANWRSRRTARERWKPMLVPLAWWAFSIPYGAWRIHQVDVENATAPALRVAVVQENLGLVEKREDPEGSLDHHLETTRRLETSQHLDLAVWSESAVSFLVHTDVPNIAPELPPWGLHVPVLLGALSMRNGRYYNTAFMTGFDGALAGTYDKTYLLAFGEYLPGGELFPKLYEMSPNSGHFTRGSRMVALPLPGDTPSAPRTVMPLICYEDILPRFVRDFQNASHATLFAVILNDAWFGDTAEPWIHFALSKFRSIEHRRDFVRAANSGVSGFVDAAGRVIAHTGTFRAESLVATVHLRTRRTPYDLVGDWAAWLAVAFTLWVIRPRWRVLGMRREDRR
jgi:apolipoprotein N-acyltransferase